MALTKISFEIEVEGTFQNGNTIDLARVYQLLAEVAEVEYDRQFEENKITRRFNFTMTGNNAPTPVEALPSEVEDVLDLNAEEAEGDRTAPRRKRNLSPVTSVMESSRLFLPR